MCKGDVAALGIVVDKPASLWPIACLDTGVFGLTVIAVSRNLMETQIDGARTQYDEPAILWVRVTYQTSERSTL